MADFVITGRNLDLEYGFGESKVNALRNVQVGILRGQWTSIMGPSGSGKTSLLQVLAGLCVPTRGSVTLHAESGDIRLSELNENQRAYLRRTKIGVIFQEFNLVPVLNVEDNIKLPMRLAHKRIEKVWFGEIIERLGLGSRLKHLPTELSGGQIQRVAIARALLSRPELIFADEPTGSLDSEASQRVLQLFRELVTDYGQTLVVITHDLTAARLGNKLISIQDGQVVS